MRSLQNVGQEGARRKHIKKNHSNPGAEGKKIETSQELPRGRNLWNLCPFCNFGSSIPEKKQSKINFGPLYLSRGSSCSEGYRLPFTSLGLNGDLNQSAGGKDIFLCLAKDLGDQGITGFKLVQRSTSCGHGWKLADHSEDLDGNLNQSAGGKDIYLCYSTGRIGSRKLVDVALRQKNSHDSMPPSTPDGLNGNLNQGTIGKEIFLNMFYERNDSRAGKLVYAGFYYIVVVTMKIS